MLRPLTLRAASLAAATPSAAAADVGMPRYYIVDSNPVLAPLPVRSSLTGKVVSTVAPPAGCDPKTIKVTAAANDQDFVLGCLARNIVLYRFRVSPAGQASTLTPLRISPPNGSFLNGLALNTDGSKLAIGLQGPGTLEVVTLATGAVRTWTGTSPFDLAWADQDHAVSFVGFRALYALDVSKPGNSLRSARLILPQTEQTGMTGAVLSENGSTVVATVEYGNVGPKLTGKTVIGGVEEFSATTRKPLRTLLTMHAHYSLDGGGSEAGWYMSPCSLGPVDATGYHVLVSCDQFDRIDRGRVTPLPGPGPQDALYTAAW